MARESQTKCPFCERPILEVFDIKTRFGSSFSGGRCSCGAVYAFDRSGHNLGDTYVDALAFACNDDWDRAWSLTPGEDYEVRELAYDSRRNRFSSAGRKTQATYLFIKVHEKSADSAGPGGQEGE